MHLPGIAPRIDTLRRCRGDYKAIDRQCQSRRPRGRAFKPEPVVSISLEKLQGHHLVRTNNHARPEVRQGHRLGLGLREGPRPERVRDGAHEGGRPAGDLDVLDLVSDRADRDASQGRPAARGGGVVLADEARVALGAPEELQRGRGADLRAALLEHGRQRVQDARVHLHARDKLHGPAQRGRRLRLESQAARRAREHAQQRRLDDRSVVFEGHRARDGLRELAAQAALEEGRGLGERLLGDAELGAAGRDDPHRRRERGAHGREELALQRRAREAHGLEALGLLRDARRLGLALGRVDGRVQALELVLDVLLPVREGLRVPQMRRLDAKDARAPRHRLR
mmetsp:Transcript_1446/g.4356  ORF Transcript_1446/g.4356 Transcript_1446/m.4356 type:complete len:340 (+) Transcript_1446:707-1726(+)